MVEYRRSPGLKMLTAYIPQLKILFCYVFGFKLLQIALSAITHLLLSLWLPLIV